MNLHETMGQRFLMFITDQHTQMCGGAFRLYHLLYPFRQTHSRFPLLRRIPEADVFKPDKRLHTF